MKLDRAKIVLNTHKSYLKNVWKPRPDAEVLEAIEIGIDAIKKEEQRQESKSYNGRKNMGRVVIGIEIEAGPVSKVPANVLANYVARAVSGVCASNNATMMNFKIVEENENGEN